MQLSKRQLGIGYLAATGVVFSVVLLLGIARAITRSDFATTGVLVTGLVPAVSLASGHVWLPRFRFTDEQVWRIATWCGIGIGGLTLLILGFFTLDWLFAPLAARELLLVTSNVTFGGVAGVVIGALWESNKMARRYRERNTVLNRVMRHNLRNDINVIQGRVTLIDRQLDHQTDHTDAIHQKINDILRLSEQSRALEQVIGSADSDPHPIDLAPVVSERTEAISDRYPAAHVERDLPPEAWVLADEMIDTVVGNLIENAIEHNDETPHVAVDVFTNDASNEVTLRIADDGPGIPSFELEVLSEGTETALQHGSGLGLWLVKWFVESYDGTFSIESTGDGSVATITLPQARPANDPTSRLRNDIRRFGRKVLRTVRS